MKIYTYYEDVGFKLQNELLDIWQKSWLKYGFQPYVLSRDDAKKSILFQQYYDFVQRVHEKSVNRILTENEYWLASQLEIVSFHTIEEPSYVSDYDMINNGFEPGETLESQVHWRNAACSCFASGNKHGWEKYIRFLFDQEAVVVNWCKKESDRTGRTEFSDQDFLLAVEFIGLKQQVYKMSKDYCLLGADYLPDQPKACKIPHLSHNNMYILKNNYPQFVNYSHDQIRVMMASQILNFPK